MPKRSNEQRPLGIPTVRDRVVQGAVRHVLEGNRIGWLDGENLYLEPEASYAAAQELAREQGDGLPVTSRTLRKRLHERGLLASTDPERDVLTVRRTLEGKRREVLHLPASSLSAEKTDQPDQYSAEPETFGQFPGRVPLEPTSNPTTKPDQKPGENGQLVGLIGSDGGVDDHSAGNSQPQRRRLRGILRHSYITLLQRSGVHPKVAQELARPSDIRLTMNVYTHAHLHDLAGAVEGLPSLLPAGRQAAAAGLKATGTDGRHVPQHSPGLIPSEIR